MAITLRKKAPFYCRTKVGEKYTCLAPLAENDCYFCPKCVDSMRNMTDRAAKPITRIEDEQPTEGRYVTEAEHQERLATSGPLWPVSDDSVFTDPDPVYHPAVQPQEVA